MDVEKALDKGAWERLVLYVVPGGVIALNFTLLLGLHHLLPPGEGIRWLAATVFAFACVGAGSMLEDVAGRFEACCVDGRLYPWYRFVAKWWRTLNKRPKNRPDRTVYLGNLCGVWERYLELSANPPDENIRWQYYGNLVRRYRSTIALGLSLGLSAFGWLFAFFYFHVCGASPGYILDATTMLTASACLSAVSLYLLFYEAPSSCAILHWHRIKLIRRYGRLQPFTL